MQLVMICFASDMLWKWRRRKCRSIPLRFPAKVVLYTGCKEERIEVEQAGRQVVSMTIYTRQGRSPNQVG